MSERRIFARGARPDSFPDVGQPCPVLEVKDIHGMPVVVGRTLVAGRSTLLMFMNTHNPSGARLLSVIQSITAREGVDVIMISDGADCEHRRVGTAIISLHRREATRQVVSAEICQRFGVDHRPCGVLLDSQGMIVARGVCTARRHVEGLFKTQRRGYYSLYGYLSRISRYARPVYGLR